MYINLQYEPFVSFCIAPGAYCPEKVKLDNPPAYSFGVRPNIDHIDNIPGKVHSFTHLVSAYL